MIESFEDTEDEIEVDVNLSKKDAILSRLNEKGLLNYGAVIQHDILEFLLDRKKKNVSPTKWEFLILQLREIIKEEGYFITSRGREGDLYILKESEMPAYNDRKTKIMFKNIRQRQRALNMISPSSLSSSYAKKLEFEILKNSRIEIEMSRIAHTRCK